MRTKRHIVAAAGVLGALAIGVAGCGSSASAGSSSSGSTASTNKTIALSVTDHTSLFYIAVADGVEAAAKKAGYKVDFESASDDSATQINQVQNMITRKPGVLIYSPTDAASSIAGVTDANNAGIPVIGIDERPPTTSSAKEVTYIGSNSVAAGKSICTYMANQIGGSGDIAIIKGVIGTTAQIERSQGCSEALKEFPKIHVVAQQTANWMEDQAYSVSQSILSAHKGLKGIFAESDAMALGVARAAQSVSYKPYPVIVSIDGFPTLFKVLRTGDTSATEAQQPYHMGELAVQDAIRILKGKAKSIPAVQYQPTFLVTKDTVKNWPANPKPGSKQDIYGPEGL